MSLTRPAWVMLLLVAGGCGVSSSPPTNDCVADPAKCACTGDAVCADPNPRCDTRTGACVACLPNADNCPSSMHCVATAGKYACIPKDSCNMAIDCPTVGDKPGLCCTGKCADPLNDGNNCGACGNVCGAVTNGVGGCVNGACATVSCNVGFGDCDHKLATGCESNLSTDGLHCGTCDTVCKAAPNSKVACVASKCEFTCSADFADCDGNPVNGCETSITTNPKACGGCGKACGALPKTMEVACVSSACVVAQCVPGFTDCNHLAADGCESDIKNDPNNCTGCGRKCPAIDNGAAGCVDGSCGIGKCNPGFADCDGNVLNGCEQQLAADPKNCGACGKTCVVPNGIAACQGGMCVLQSCSPNFFDCDMNANNGCEVDTRFDLKNCGQCGMACPVPGNATASCSQGVCGIGSCMYGFADCNKNLNDGCEASILQPNNCGVCGGMCAVPPNATAACPAAVCAIGQCNVGFADCDMKVPNGCEVALAADGNNCGACGVVCVPKFNQAGSCVASKCTLGACLQGYGDCNNNLVDGCEINLNSDDKNCAGCGKACPNGQTCSNGVCQACGVDCWGPTGCVTAQGKCIQFTCRAGNAGGAFCNGCKGWKEITYDMWMNQGYCADVIARYRQSDGNTTHCGGAAACCNGVNNCGGGDNAWHFYDTNGQTNYFVGPCIGCANDVNCKYWNNIDTSAYTRITACMK